MLTADQLKAVDAFTVAEGIPVEADVSLKRYSYFKSGGLAKRILYPNEELQLQRLLTFMSQESLPYKVIGDTSNIMFLDDRLYGVFVSLRAFNKIELSDTQPAIITAQAGAALPEFARQALLWGFTGFEGLEGIPGTIGGAVIMNAGAYGDEIKDCILSVEGFLSTGEPFRFEPRDMKFRNRNSVFRDELGKYIVLSATFRGVPGDRKEIFRKMELFHAKRHTYQDFLYPTLGSVFSTLDLYNDLAHDDPKLLFLIKWFKRAFYSKKIRRHTPMNRVKLNRFMCRYFGWTFDEQPFSDKTMNSITNRGQHTDVFLAYIELLKTKLPDTVHIENELMFENLFEE